MWKLLQAEHSHIATVCVPLLLHCLTLPSGADVFWNLVENDFNDEDWKIRFAAGKRTVCCVSDANISNNNNNIQNLYGALCNLKEIALRHKSDVHLLI